MLNLFKYELKRAFSSKSTYVIMLVFILFTLLPIAGNYYFIKTTDSPSMLEAMKTSSMEEFESKEDNKEEKTVNKEELEKLKKEAIHSSFSFEENAKHFTGGGLLLIMLTIFMSITATKEYSSGYIKNLMTIKGYRKMMPFAKIFIAIIYSMLLMLISITIYSLTSSMLTGALKINWNKLLVFFGVNLLSLTTLSSMIILIANLTSSITATVTISVLLVQNILTPFLIMFDGIKVLPFKLIDLSLINKATNFSMGLKYNEMINYVKDFLPIIAVYFVVYITLNLIILNKKDINLG